MIRSSSYKEGSLSAGWSGSHKTGISEDRSDAGNRRWAPFSQGGAASREGARADVVDGHAPAAAVAETTAGMFKQILQWGFSRRIPGRPHTLRRRGNGQAEVRL